jgi:tripartite-type tricarboxylate transporter receptor subunit TctC
VQLAAHKYGNDPRRLTAPYAVGGPTDVFARIAVQTLSGNLGKQL